jgi:hypothetical protein
MRAHVIDFLPYSSFYLIQYASVVCDSLIDVEKAVETLEAPYLSAVRDLEPLKTHQSSIALPLYCLAKGDEGHDFSLDPLIPEFDLK